MKPLTANKLLTGFISNLTRIKSKEDQTIVLYTLLQKCIYYLSDGRTKILFNLVVALAT